MNDIEVDSTGVWAIALVVVLPVLIIVLGEVQERLRQRDSALVPAGDVLRTWVVPLLAFYLLLANVFDLGEDHLAVRLVGTGVLLSVLVAGLAAVRVFVDRLRSRPRVEGQRAVPQLLLALPRALVFGAVVWVLLDGVWGVDLSQALTALGVTSLVISFALQDTLSGLASGMLLLGDQPFQPGDWISTGELEGRVVDVNWRSTRIEDRNGDLVVVPNATLAGATLVNYDQPTRVHRVQVPVQVAYMNAPTRAKEMLLAAARSTPDVLADPPPNAIVTAVDDPLMTYEVHLWIDDYAKVPKVKSDFGSLVWYWSNRLDVPLPSPAQDLYLYDGVQAGLAGVPTPDDLSDRLAHAPLLAHLDRADLDALAASARQQRFARGEVIVSENQDRSDFYVLVEGEAGLVALADGESVDVGTLVRGEVFGLVQGSERGAALRVVARSDCEVVVVDGDEAGRLVSRRPDLAAAFNQLVSLRSRRGRRALSRMVAAASALPEGSESSKGSDG